MGDDELKAIRRFAEVKENCVVVLENELDIGVGRMDKCGAFVRSNRPCQFEICPKVEGGDP